MSNPITDELNEYLCEQDIYTPENYDKVRAQYSEFIEPRADKWNTSIFKHDTDAFVSYFQEVFELTNDWIVARMIIHVAIQSFEACGVSLFEWADDTMIDYLHNQCNR